MNKPETVNASAPAAGSAVEGVFLLKLPGGVDGEEMPNEQKALAVGLVLVNAKWDGESDFDRGMRLLQKKLCIKR